MPDVVAAWVEDICTSFDFKRIIPAHLAAPIRATPQDLRCADATRQLKETTAHAALTPVRSQLASFLQGRPFDSNLQLFVAGSLSSSGTC